MAQAQGLHRMAVYAAREMRGGLRGFRIFLACLAIGVAAIAAVGSLSQAFLTGLAEQGRVILGGDAEFRVIHRPIGAAETAFLSERAALSRVVEMRGMARAGGNSALVELKAVDSAWPLTGAAVFAPAMTAEAALDETGGRFGAAVEASLLDRLGARIGDSVRVGAAEFELRAVIESEPDRVAGGFTLGPRLLLSQAGLAATGLEQPGSLITYAYRVALPGSGGSAADVRALVEAARDAFPDAGWQIRDRANGAPGLRRFVVQVSLFLTLVGLAALVVGGVGVGNAVSAYLERKRATIATLKSLGASGGFVFGVYFVQVMILAALGIAIGLALGAAAPFVALWAAGDALPAPAALGVFWQPLALAGLFGILTAIAFATWPLARAREIAPAGLFRDIVAPSRAWPRLPYILIAAGAAIAVAALAVLFAPDRSQIFAIGFLIGATIVFAVLRLLAAAIQWAAKRAPRMRNPLLRLAIANLHRPGALTPAVVLSLGLGLTLLVAVALIDGNLQRSVANELPERAPSFFFVDIQSNQIAAFRALVETDPATQAFETSPMIRGRITRVNGVPSADVAARTDPEYRWVLSGDRGITYGADARENATLVEGQWWPEDYSGPVLLSFDARLARGLGLGIGDRMTLNVLGREIEGEIANLREVDYSSGGMGFVLVVSPGILEAAPHAHLATARVAPEAEARLASEIVTQFPNVSVVRVKEAIATVNALIQQLATGVRAAAAVSILTGLLVLAGALAAGHRNRVYDSAILKSVGATRARVLTVYVLEFAMLGLATALVALGAGAGAAWVVITQVMQADWVMLPGVAMLTLGVSTLAAVALGLLGTWRALGAPAARVLRAA